jgi:hypothetical protein
MDSLNQQVFLLWPAVVILSALLSMLTQWRFSWSELVMDYLAGMVIGLFFFLGTQSTAGFLAHSGLVFSHGLWGLLFVTSTIATRDDLFWIAAGTTLGATLVAGLLDRAAVAIGNNLWGSLLSLVLLPLKLPFALVTSTVGLGFFVVGLYRRTNEDKNKVPRTGIGLNGGLVYVEWDASSAAGNATTLGISLQVWTGPLARAIEHELYHSRQYVMLRDWMIPTWIVGGIWGLISSAIDGSFSMEAFISAKHDKEVGNPMERVPYQIYGYSNF